MNREATWLERGVALYRSGQIIDAVVCYRNAMSQQPGEALVHYNLALALQDLGRENEAADFYRRALGINPRLAEAYTNLGNILANQKRMQDAQAAYETALHHKPGLPEALMGLGLVLRKQQAFSAAAEYFKKVLELSPTNGKAFDNLCSTLMALSRTEEWLDVFRRYEATAGRADWYFVAGLSACRHLGDFSLENRYLAALIDYSFKDEDADMLDGILSTIQYFDLPPAEIYKLYQHYNAIVRKKHFPEIPLVSPYRIKGRKIRIGYLSADFRIHVMGYLMYEVLAGHDKDRFEIYLYSLARKEDKLTEKYRALTQRFAVLTDMPSAEAAKRIAADELDILVDLCNHTTDSNPYILAYKPARVQITHLGAHGTVGLETVDYKLTDHYTDRPENAEFQIEKLLPMEGCIFPFLRLEVAANHPYTRAQQAIPENSIVFGVFANIMKLSPRLLGTWKKILDEIPNGLLAFSPLKEAEPPSFIRQAGAAGIAAERIIFIPTSKDAKVNRARYALLDAALDTFPYSGGDTTLAALDMGVPVVTLCGKRHAERTSYSLLRNLGVTSTIAYSEDEYVQIATRLARDLDFRNSVKAELEHGLTHAPMMNIDFYIRNLESAYLRALEPIPVKDIGDSDALKQRFQEAVRLHQAGEISKASVIYDNIISQQPDFPQALYLRGVIAKERGNYGRATELLQRAIAVSPAYLDAQNALANVYLEQQNYPDALDVFNRVLQIQPNQLSALNGLGWTFFRTGKTADAVKTFEGATRVKPDDPISHFNLGCAYQERGQINEAAAAYTRALGLDANYAEAYFNLGTLFQEYQHWEKAANYYRSALRLDPGFAAAYFHLGDVLIADGKITAWIDNFHAFKKNAAPCFELALYGVEACHYEGEFAQSLTYLNELIRGKYEIKALPTLSDRLEQLLYIALFFDVSQQDMLSLYQRYNALSQKLHARMLLPDTANVGAKIRVGYVSPDFRNHVMGKMMFAVLAQHNRQQFEIYCYSLTHKEDRWTEKFREKSHKFISIAGKDAQTAAQIIAKDKIDILIDLATHTKGSLPAIFSCKPSPIQITHIASAGALGLATVDFKLTDHFADPPLNQNFMLETLLPIEGCVFPYRHIQPAKVFPFSRRQLGIADDAFVFGEFVTLLKLSPRCLDLWRRVLQAVPKSVLAFSPHSDEAKQYYLRCCVAADIAPERVTFIPINADEAINQARYRLVNAVLDTLPFGGVNGTIEALDMTVPVVTLCGEKHGERTSFSVLSNLGVTSTIAYSPEEYIALAQRLASDAEFYATVQADIRSGIANSTFTDVAAHTRNLETAYQYALNSTKELAN